MVDRVYMRGSPPRLITSKPGYNASPSLDDANKTFDSDWFNGGGIKFHLRVPHSASSAPFPYALNYTPTVLMFDVYDKALMDSLGFWSAGATSVGPPPPSNAVGLEVIGGYNVSNTQVSGITPSDIAGNKVFLVMEG